MQITNKLVGVKDVNQKMELHQGDCIKLRNGEDLFQVIGIDNEHKRCWIRQWPLLPKGSPVFEVSLQQISLNSLAGQNCPGIRT